MILNCYKQCETNASYIEVYYTICFADIEWEVFYTDA